MNRGAGAGATAAPSNTNGAAAPEKAEDIDALKSQLNAMQAQLEKLVKDRG